jgi:hypothetical protein
MKCPVCWAEKAYVRHPKSWKDVLLSYLLVVPLRCHHCYHEFYVPWFLTIGKKTAAAGSQGGSSTRSSSPPHEATSIALSRQRPGKVACRPLNQGSGRKEAA